MIASSNGLYTRLLRVEKNGIKEVKEDGWESVVNGSQSNQC